SAPAAGAPAVPATPGALERLADVPIYSSDPIVRRAESLQKTRDARPARARANGATIARLGLVAGDPVRVRQSAGGVAGEATLELERDDALADGVVRVAAGQPGTAGLVCAFGAISIEKA
ncbi:MAG: NADH-quinone oxidoreductase subunit G, partial [Burkholderiaceae bacterium]|nr:NADH-quinone oxidoreductase subunit G [Burkholderiaceae bacterium]